MDVFEKARMTRPHIEGADENLAAARVRLLAEIQDEPKPVSMRSSRRSWIVAGGLVGAAAAVTAGVLVVNALSAPASQVEAIPTKEPLPTSEPMPTGEPTPASSPTPEPSSPTQVLLSAAGAAAGYEGTEPQPGQYVRLEWSGTNVTLFDAATGESGEEGWGGSHATATGAWQTEVGGVYYIPGDLTSEWFSEYRSGTIVRTFGDVRDAQDAMQHRLDDLAAQPLAPYVKPQFWNEDVEVTEDLGTFLDRMPRDPDALIAWVRDYAGAEQRSAGWGEGNTGWFLIEMLSYNVGPSDLRAAMYRALSTLPGSTVSDEADGIRTVTFDSLLEYAGDRSDLVLNRMTVSVEMSTGLVVEVSKRTDAGRGIVPADVPDHMTRYSVTIVDELPGRF